MHIWVLSDGKPGHVNQSLGLADALMQKAGGDMSIIELKDLGFFKKLTTISNPPDIPKPDIVISAGHSTHLPLLWAASTYKVPSIVCMKPSLPPFLFGLCVVPRHDFPPGKHKRALNMFPTIGAMHNIRPQPDIPKTKTLIMIGGPSKEYGWNPHMIKELLLDFIEPHTEGEIILTTSRRTPEGFIDMFKEGETKINIIPESETYRGWVAEQLAGAKAAWVTEDSVSMVYEALGSGCPVGIIPSPREIGNCSRVAYGLSLLLQEKRVIHLNDWVKTHQFYEQNEPLREADRVADYILQRYPQLTQP